MRFLKRLILAVLIYLAVYLPFIAVLQALTGTDLTAAFSVGGIVGAVELALGSIIKITENREVKKDGYNGNTGTGSQTDIRGADDICSAETESSDLGKGRGE